jgi:hypothetical protein
MKIIFIAIDPVELEPFKVKTFAYFLIKAYLSYTVHLQCRKSRKIVWSLIKRLRPELEIIVTNYIPEVVSDL